MQASPTPRRHYYRVVVKAISLDRKASRHDAAYDQTVLAESRSSALAKCREDILALKCNDPTIKRISVYVGSNKDWWRLDPISIPRGE